MLCWGQVVSHESLTILGGLALLYSADRKYNQTPRCSVDGVRPRSSSSLSGVVMWTHLESSCRTLRQSSLLPLQGVSHPYPDEGGRGSTGQDVGVAAALGAPLVGILWELRAS